MDMALQAWCQESMDAELEINSEYTKGAYHASRIFLMCLNLTQLAQLAQRRRLMCARVRVRVDAVETAAEVAMHLLPSGVQKMALFSDAYRCSEEACALDEHCELPAEEGEGGGGLLASFLSMWRYQGLSG
jgi:hypothetical protein